MIELFIEDSTLGLEFWQSMCQNTVIKYVGKMRLNSELLSYIHEHKALGVESTFEILDDYIAELGDTEYSDLIIALAVDFVRDDTLKKVQDVIANLRDKCVKYIIFSTPSFESSLLSSNDYRHRGNFNKNNNDILGEVHKYIEDYCKNGCIHNDILREQFNKITGGLYVDGTLETDFKRFLSDIMNRARSRRYKISEGKLYWCLSYDCDKLKYSSSDKIRPDVCKRCPHTDALVNKLLATTKDSPFSIIYDTNIEELKPWIIRNNYNNEVQ